MPARRKSPRRSKSRSKSPRRVLKRRSSYKGVPGEPRYRAEPVTIASFFVLGAKFQSLPVAMYALWGLFMSLAGKVMTMSNTEFQTEYVRLQTRLQHILGDLSSITESEVQDIAAEIQSFGTQPGISESDVTFRTLQS